MRLRDESCSTLQQPPVISEYISRPRSGSLNTKKPPTGSEGAGLLSRRGLSRAQILPRLVASELASQKPSAGAGYTDNNSNSAANRKNCYARCISFDRGRELGAKSRIRQGAGGHDCPASCRAAA